MVQEDIWLKPVKKNSVADLKINVYKIWLEDGYVYCLLTQKQRNRSVNMSIALTTEVYLGSKAYC